MKKIKRDPIDDELVEIEEDTNEKKSKEEEPKGEETKEDDVFDFNKLIDIESPEDLMKNLGNIPKSHRPKNIKVINFPQRFSYNIFLNSLIVLLINTMIIFSLLGYTSVVYYQSFVDVIYYTLIFSVAEIFMKELIFYYYPMLVLKSLGSILLAITVLAFLIADVSIKNITFASTSSLVFFIIAFLIIRTTITNIIINKKIERLFFGRKKK